MALLAGRARLIALDLPGFGALGRAARRIRARHGEPTAWRTRSRARRGACGRLRPLAGRPAGRAPRGAPPGRRLASDPGRPERAGARAGLAAPRRSELVPLYQAAAARAVPLGALAACRCTPLRRAALAPLVDRPGRRRRRDGARLVDGGRAARELPAARRARSRGPGRGGRAWWPSRSRRSGATATAWCPPPTPSCSLRAVPSAAIRFLPGCGHMPMVERPEAFAALLAALALE